jgi:C4-dicarboxylate-specific signal transduction histidine kinase
MASFSTLLAFTVRFWPRAERSPHSRIHEHKDDLDRVNKVRDGSVANVECLDKTPTLFHVARLSYRRFVEEGLTREIENPLAAIQWQIALGGERFLQKIRDRVTALPDRRREITSIRQATQFVHPMSYCEMSAEGSMWIRGD